MTRAIKNLSKFQVEKSEQVSAGHLIPEKSWIVDCALVWIPHCPLSDSKQKLIATNFMKKLKHHFQEKLKVGDMYLVFNRNEDFSIKVPNGAFRMENHSGKSHFTVNCPIIKLLLQLHNIILKNLRSDSEKYRLMITNQEKNLSYRGNVQKYDAYATQC